jgi:dihydroorotase
VKSLILIQPDDWHVHLRTGQLLSTVVAHTARQFARAMVMPNLKPPISTVAMALNYRQQILQALPEGSTFQPLMTLYLTPQTTVEEVKKVAESNAVYAFKWYPAGATTHSEAGVDNIVTLYPILAAMQQYDVPLLIHGEVTDKDCDIFDRERLFIEKILIKVITDFPQLRIVLEHITTKEAVQFVESSAMQIAATITPQHLLLNRNALFSGGIRPHHYCLPILKREVHRLALVQAAISGNPKFFLGTDSAPHPIAAKQSQCGCAGCYSAHAAIELYAQVFEHSQALDRLENFAAVYGANFYRLPLNQTRIQLQKQQWIVPSHYGDNDDQIQPLFAGEALSWKSSVILL